MFDLFNTKVEYPINHLLGLDVKDPLLQSFYHLDEKNDLILVSQLAVEGTPRIGLLANQNSLSPSELEQRLCDLKGALSKVNAVQEISSGWIYDMDASLKNRLHKKELEGVNNGLLFLDDYEAQLTADEINELIFEFQLQELSPVLVFPEKNRLFIRNPKLLTRLHHRGVYFLVDWLSLNGSLGHLSQKIALSLLGDKSIKCIGFRNKDLSAMMQKKGFRVHKQVARQLDEQLFS